MPVQASDQPGARAAIGWQPRIGATHLSQGPGGVWYFRLAIPLRIRAADPTLPRELKRSTKTGEKRLALARAREMCIDFVTRLSTKNLAMLALDELTKQAFSIAYVDGAIRVQTSPNANSETVLLMGRMFQHLTAQMVARGVRQLSSGNDAISSDASVTAPSAAPANNDRVDLEAPPLRDDDDEEEEEAYWLSDAIDLWLSKGGVAFRKETWEYSYKPTYRVFKELVANQRRDRTMPDGTHQFQLLDTPVRQINRATVRAYHDGLKELPARQGQRSDGVEAKERIRQGRKDGLKPPSLSSVVKKLEHIKPFLVYAKSKGWISEAVLDELKISMKDAVSKVIMVEKQARTKPGAVALSSDELKRTFEQPLFTQMAIKWPSQYWVPLLYLYAGLRVSESSGLHSNDIFDVDGVPCISVINDQSPDDAETNDGLAWANDQLPGSPLTYEEFRRVKNSASRRVIPLHPRLLELGLLDFVHQRKMGLAMPIHLFPELRWEPKSMYGRQPSERIGRLLRVAGVHQTRRKVAHSLCSNIAQALDKVGLHTDLIQRFLGHSTGKMNEDSYGETDIGPALPMQLILDHLKQVQFSFDVPTWSEIRKTGIEVAGRRRAKTATCGPSIQS